MPTQSAPHPAAPQPPRKPPRSSAAPTPPGPDAAAPKPAREGGLFRLLVESGCDPVVAYTAERRIETMTSETATARLQPVVAEIREMRESMVTKADLANCATKTDLANCATKTDLANFATKADLANCATKADLAQTEANLRREIAERETRLIKWMLGALMAQAALIVALVVGFMSLLL